MTMQATSARLDLAALNAMNRDDFVAALGSTFEHSPWVAERAWTARPFASVDQLHAAMLDVVRSAPPDAQLAFLCGHPELAGREAQEATMTADSVSEQASAGLDALTRDEMSEMQRLNKAYLERHGFPFVIAVRRHTKQQIFAEMRRRVGANTVTEFSEALAQIGYITRMRVGALVQSA
jgi:2-oxo-4-hydroxy-4-carboxy-5-ureidoimidazoline decarboxylase